MIKFENIQVKFGDFVAIDDINLEIQKGEFFTFLGPSGCGKTTTLRSLVGFNKPSLGNVYMNGNNITNLPIEKRNIGIVFQSYALFPTMSVKENIKYGMIENKWPKDKIEERLNYVSKIVNLNESQLDKNVSNLSGGQQQRVAIARALSLNPDVICLDEPLSNLDAKLRESLRDELKRIQKESGTTMIYVTHDQEEALMLSDKIAIFNEGKIQQIGTPEQIYFNPENEFVASFIGNRYKLDDNFISAIEENNNISLERNHDYYLMAESLRQADESLDNNYDIFVNARLINQVFQGILIKRDYEINGATYQSVVFTKDAKEIKDKNNVRLAFNSNELIEFERPHHDQ